MNKLAADMRGPVRCFAADSRKWFALSVVILTLAVLPAPASTDIPDADPAAHGQWSASTVIPFMPIHGMMLQTGKVLLWGRAVEQTVAAMGLWNLSTETFEPLPPQPWAATYDIVCAGHVLLPDGRAFIVGGNDTSEATRGQTVFFNPVDESWQVGPRMHAARWYPTTTLLPDGDMLVLAGAPANVQPVVERFSGSAWHVIPGASRPMKEYPNVHVLPSGKLIRTGPESETVFFDPASGAWSAAPDNPHAFSLASVLLPTHDRVLLVASVAGTYGIGRVTKAEVLDLNGEPRWRSVGELDTPATDDTGVNLTLLADGAVLAMGGGLGPTVPQLFDPDTETWTTLAGSVHSRGVHSVSLLLPDGRVLSTGGSLDGTLSAPLTLNFFSPPYLFRGPRPTIASSPEHMSYGSAYGIRSPDAPRISKVALVGFGSNTHSTDFSQRYVTLQIQHRSDEELTVSGPRSGWDAPPGWYMLFLLDQAGVPSVSSVVQVS